MAQGRKTGGRQKGAKNKSTIEREAGRQEIVAQAINGLTEEQIQAITPRDMFRLVAIAAVRMGSLPLILKAAADWAPYEHPKLAPKPEEAPAETDEERAYRLRCTMTAMRATIGEQSADAVAEATVASKVRDELEAHLCSSTS
jgi:hypothetical protein